jgi:hypothetical protein
MPLRSGPSTLRIAILGLTVVAAGVTNKSAVVEVIVDESSGRRSSSSSSCSSSSSREISGDCSYGRFGKRVYDI